MSIFRNKKFNSVVVRLNVEDNYDAERLDDPWFWPEGIVCKPWLSRNMLSNRSNRFNTQTDNRTYGNRKLHVDSSYSIENRNRFSALAHEID